MDNPRSDGGFASRCCVRLMHEVVSKFDPKKRELVESTGFGGMLHFPPMRQINRKFAMWIMGCVDESSETIVVGDHIRIKFTKDDIRTVFGIPSCGKRVLDNQISSRDTKDKVIQ